MPRPKRYSRHVTVRVTPDTHEAIRAEAMRQDRSMGYMLRQSWFIARSQITNRPAETDQVKPSAAAEETKP